MTLNSLLFFTCVAAACVVNYILPRKVRYLWLLVCSWAFYLYAAADVDLHTPMVLQRLGAPEVMPGVVPAFCVLLAVTAATWFFCLLMAHAKPVALRVVFLCLSLASCVGLWVACKYLGLLGFFRPYTGGLLTKGAVAAGLSLPLGLSFYTLQAAGYSADVFRRAAPAEKNPLRYAAFIAFFPAITAGPANRAAAMMPQLREPARFDYGRVAGGAFRILWGVVKKSVIADGLALYTGAVFRTPTLHVGPTLTLAVVLFAVQLYMDFSGLCDIAVGAARMLGIANAENFQNPFAARTLPELWQRWFASFTGILRDNVWRPMVGHEARNLARIHKIKSGQDDQGEQSEEMNRKSPRSGRGAGARNVLMRWLAPFLATLLCAVLYALWHGVGGLWLQYGLVAGGITALAAALAPARDRLAAKVPGYRNPYVRGAIQRVWVFLLFCFTLVFFLAAMNGQPLSDWAARFLWNWNGIFTGEVAAALTNYGLTLKQAVPIAAATALVASIEGVALRRGGTVADWVRRRKFYVRWPLYYALIAATVFFGVFEGAAGYYQAF